MDTTFKKKGYKLIRDLFIFYTFSGLAYMDMYNLTKENLQTSFEGHLWILKERKKTGVESCVRLLDIPRRILEKYAGKVRNSKSHKALCVFRNLFFRSNYQE